MCSVILNVNRSIILVRCREKRATKPNDGGNLCTCCSPITFRTCLGINSYIPHLLPLLRPSFALPLLSFPRLLPIVFPSAFTIGWISLLSFLLRPSALSARSFLPCSPLTQRGRAATSTLRLRYQQQLPTWNGHADAFGFTRVHDETA